MKKTIKAKISEETNQTKIDILDRTLDRWNTILEKRFNQGIEEYEKLKVEDCHSVYPSFAEFKAESKEEPLPLKTLVFSIERKSNTIAEYWMQLPTGERRGGVWLPVKMAEKYHGFEEEWEVKDSKLTKEENEYYVHIVIEKDVEIKEEYCGVLGVDLGVRHVAVTWNTVREKPSFYGKELREVRGKYHCLRQKLQSEGKHEAVENIKDREHRKSDYLIHNISREIVNQAKEDNLAIVIGDLSGYRDSDFGKKGNRHLHQAPIRDLKLKIKYKAEEAGVLCKVIDESYTTVTCSSCGYERDSRPGKQFVCPKCGYEVNSDVNGAKNISERGSGYISDSGAFVVSSNPDTVTT